MGLKKSKVIELSSTDEFLEFVEKNELVLIDFYGKMCPPCKVQSKMLNDDYDTLVGVDERLKIIKIMTAKVRDITQSFKIVYVPQLFLFYKGLFLRYEDGYVELEDIIGGIKHHIEVVDEKYKSGTIGRTFYDNLREAKEVVKKAMDKDNDEDDDDTDNDEDDDDEDGVDDLDLTDEDMETIQEALK